MINLSPPKPKLAEKVANLLSEAIDRQGWEEGRPLPPVRKLAEQFNVSPNTAHSAVQMLVERGVLRLKPRGTVVQRKLPAVARRQIGVLAVGGDTPVMPPPPSDFTHDWVWSILGGAQADMHRADKMMAMIPAHLFDKDPLASLLERIDSVRPTLAGLICFPLNWPHGRHIALFNAIDERQIPYVTINQVSDLHHHNFVTPDYVGGTRLLARCLARMGLSRVLILTSSNSAHSHSQLERIGGLFQGYVMENCPTSHISTAGGGGFTAEFGYDATRRFLAENPAPQVVVALGDLLAEGAMQALKERGLRIPQDVSVVGGTGLPQAADMVPSLTTLALPMAEVGRQAMQMLLEMERADITRMTGRTVPGELIVRQSLVVPESIRGVLQEESETWSFKTDH